MGVRVLWGSVWVRVEVLCGLGLGFCVGYCGGSEWVRVRVLWGSMGVRVL